MTGVICAKGRGVKWGDVKFPLMPEYADAYEGQDRVLSDKTTSCVRLNRLNYLQYLGCRIFVRRMIWVDHIFGI